MTAPRSEAVSPYIPRTSGVEPSALWMLFTLTLRQFLYGKRAIVLLVLAVLPALLALIVRLISDKPATPPGMHLATLESTLEFWFVLMLVPHVLMPLTALLYSSGMILDEQEEQTLTYLLIRPLPKWALYLTKQAAVLCMVTGLGMIYVALTYLVCRAGSAGFGEEFPGRMLLLLVITALASMAYSAGFAFLSMWTRWVLILGIVYIVLIEGVLANIDFALRRLTVMYYFRVLSLNWVGLDRENEVMWQVNKSDTPSSVMCVIVLLLLSCVATLLGMWIFSKREFYVKTPEGS
jgi:ABC-2 type transport system permease protein